jgi:cytoskeletal protein RodZ
MSSVGSYLRELREGKGVSLDEIARATRVAPRYLEALEADQHSALPEPPFTRGFIRAYCQVLGEPPDVALARYTERDKAPAPAAPVVGPRPAEHESRSRGTIVMSFVLLVVLGAALLALTIALRSGRERGVDVAATPEPSAESRPRSPAPPAGPGPAVETPGKAAAGAAAPAPGGGAGTTPARVTPAPAAPVPGPAGTSATTGSTTVADSSPRPETPGSASAAAAAIVAQEARGMSPPYRLVVRTSEPTWLSVRTTDGRVMEDTIPAGETREWASNTPFVVTVGNAGGLRFELNGRELPPLGARGAVIYRLALPPATP